MTDKAPDKGRYDWEDGDIVILDGLLKDKRFDPSQPRDEHGQWTDGGGGSDGGDGASHPGGGYSDQAYVKDGVIHTSDVYDAVRALHEGRKVELDQPRGVSVLINKLGEISKGMIAKGEKAPNYNLCLVTIKATSLFCADTKGIPRVQMPQLAKEQDAQFFEYLKAKGYGAVQEEQYASHLRATQNELNGAKVAAIARKLQSPAGYNSNPIFVSKDDYILDGHHRWAAEIGVDAANNVLADSKKMSIYRIDIPITKLLEEAESFTEGKGKLGVEEDRKKRALGVGAVGSTLEGGEIKRPQVRLAGLDAYRRRGDLLLSERSSAHSEFMDECVPRLMDMGKDQIVAVAACLNMWRAEWEEAHPEGADDPGPDRPTDEEGSDLPRRGRAYNEAEHPRDEHGRWTDGGGSDDVDGNVPSTTGYTDEQTADAMESALVRPLASATATKLDFNPELIEYSDEDKEFKLAGATYKYAGSYTFGSPGVTLYTKQINVDNVRGITAHEIGHRKFQLLQETYRAETEQVMADPGPPPDPNHPYYWGKRGGSAAVMKPDGTLRPPYDTKYPLYEEWQQIQNMMPSLEDDDGITNYSKAYWSEWKKGNVDTNLAYHETMAEIAYMNAKMGKNSANTGAGWRRLFALQEKVWAETDKVLRDTNLAAPVKSIFILDGVRWEVR